MYTLKKKKGHIQNNRKELKSLKLNPCTNGNLEYDRQMHSRMKLRHFEYHRLTTLEIIYPDYNFKESNTGSFQTNV